MEPAPQLLCSIAAHGLPGIKDPILREPLSDSEWSVLLIWAQRERLVPMLSRAVAERSLAATVEQADDVSHASMVDSCRILSLETLLTEVVDLLEQSGIDHRVLKGSAVARLDYPESTLRSFIDIDILVPAHRFDAAVAALESAGHERRFPELSPGFDSRFGKGATFQSSVGLEIDLHRTFDRGPFGIGIDLADLWKSSATFDMRGRTFRTLALEERFLSLCFHAALSDVPPRLVPLRDIAQILYGGHLDGERLERVSRSWRCEAVVARAVNLAWSTLSLTEATPLSSWAARYIAGRRDAKALALYVDNNQSHATRALAIVRLLPGVRNKAAYLRAVLFPSRSYRAAVAESPLGRIRRVNQPWRYAGGSEPATGSPGEPVRGGGDASR